MNREPIPTVRDAPLVRGFRPALVDPGKSTGLQIRLDLHGSLLSVWTGLLKFRAQGRPPTLADRTVAAFSISNSRLFWSRRATGPATELVFSFVTSRWDRFAGPNPP